MKLVLIVKLIFYKDVPFNFLLPSLNNYIKANVFYGNINVKIPPFSDLNWDWYVYLFTPVKCKIATSNTLNAYKTQH